MITEFINYLGTIRGYSNNTCTGYGKDLKHFTRWMKEKKTGARWGNITRTDIDNYITACVNAGMKPATTNRRLAAISAIYRYMQREGYEVTNPAQYESRRKRGYTLPNTIDKNELKNAYNHAYGLVKVMLGLLITTGIRIQELLDIKWEDIDFLNNSIRIKGKGNKERYAYTLPEQLETLHECMKLQHHTGVIFKMSQREARRMIFLSLRPYCNAKQLSPHAIRHTFATNLAEKGVNTSTLQSLLGHKRLETSQHYVNLSKQAAQRASIMNSLLN